MSPLHFVQLPMLFVQSQELASPLKMPLRWHRNKSDYIEHSVHKIVLVPSEKCMYFITQNHHRHSLPRNMQFPYQIFLQESSGLREYQEENVEPWQQQI